MLFGIVRLQGDRAGAGDLSARSFASAIPVGGLRPAHDLLVVHLDRNRVALDDDVLGEPLVVFRRGLLEVDDVIEAAGSDVIGVRVVDLDFEALRRKATRGSFVAANLLILVST